MQLPRKGHNHEARPSRGTQRKRAKIQAHSCNNRHKNREEPPWKGHQKQKKKKKKKKNGKRKVQGVPQSQTAALPRHQEEEKTDKSKQTQIEQMYENHYD